MLKKPKTKDLSLCLEQLKIKLKKFLKKYLQNQKFVLLYVQVKCLMAYNLNFI